MEINKKHERVLRFLYEHQLVTRAQVRDLLAPFFSTDTYRKAVEVLRELEHHNYIFYIKGGAGYYRATEKRAIFGDENQLKMF